MVIKSKKGDITYGKDATAQGSVYTKEEQGCLVFSPLLGKQISYTAFSPDTLTCIRALFLRQRFFLYDFFIICCPALIYEIADASFLIVFERRLCNKNKWRFKID